MRTKESIQSTIASLLTGLRAKKGLSKTKMAETIGVDKHTWLRWESGASSPGIADLILICDALCENTLTPLLDVLYPTENTMQDPNPVEDMRKAAAHYYLDEASDHKIRVWNYMMHVVDRGEINSQVEAFCAMDHLPLQYRYFVAEQIYVYYMTARRSGELVHTDTAMPDIEEFQEGLKRMQKSAFDQLKAMKGDK